METAKKWDVDDDGIIDNGGFADQTFDAWTMSGARYVGETLNCWMSTAFLAEVWYKLILT